MPGTGKPAPRIVLDPLMVPATLSLSGAILAVSALTYPGLGTQPPTAHLGDLA